MQENEILDRVTEIITNELQIEAEITRETSLLQEGIMDSMDWMAFTTILEEKFSIEIPTDEADKYQIALIENLIEYVIKKTK